MTRTEAKQVAAQARRFGYFNHGPNSQFDGKDMLVVACPRCRQRVETCQGYRWVPVRKGQPYSEVHGGRPCRYAQENAVQALDRAMIDHLTSEGECQP